MNQITPTWSDVPWNEDILGPDFYATSLPLGTDPDGEGTIEATLVAYQPQTPGFADRPALLWVHGMTDYFFNTPTAQHFHELGYAFYAVDLRKCGRSRREGQRWHYVSDLSYYYTDLDKALDTIPNQSVVPMGHSTGGLICTLWLNDRRPKNVKGLILNGPWLDMMGVSRLTYNLLKPVVNTVGKYFPLLPFPGGNLTAFGDSMHVSRYGEWDYDLGWKPLHGHRKYVGWLRTIVEGFDRIHRRGIDVGVPYLTVCSTRSILSEPYSRAINYVDAVVDVNQTAMWATTLGEDHTLLPIHGARHEAFSSVPKVREQVFSVTDAWLERLDL
ncbi:lysophospholipase [Corynebacterium phocae]|uniref:Lysophospholipase n=1 Tax=Corynebacterium phocae TaxID=161895 RepID=A0A1L7D2F9_9CORY|nr:alpha/beta hydrolase [Corynebacterium phocae]APT92329.1 lysophospholipase [Corynebacterium phocae]KAA8724920.1 alpha/beta hydrolase [Corynebacterium phocae]